MHIEELKEREQGEFSGSVNVLCKADGSIVLWWDAKRILVGAGARALFYPTLLYNIVRNKIQAEFRWWDWIDDYVLLGAVPFPSDINRLKELGVSGVVTLNEAYETLIPSSLYEAHGIQHLVLPTRDYLFAPSLVDICRAVNFIHENAFTSKVHMYIARLVGVAAQPLSFVKYRQMMPDAAYEYVKSIRPRVLLASSQWKAVQEFCLLEVGGRRISSMTNLPFRIPGLLYAWDFSSFDDRSMVIVTESDLDGYDADNASVVGRNRLWGDVNIVSQVRIVGEAVLAKLSCLWVPPVTTIAKRLTQQPKSGD